MEWPWLARMRKCVGSDWFGRSEATSDGFMEKRCLALSATEWWMSSMVQFKLLIIGTCNYARSNESASTFCLKITLVLSRIYAYHFVQRRKTLSIQLQFISLGIVSQEL